MSDRHRALFILGTRPEAIKLAPLILLLRKKSEEWDVKVCATGQHSDLLDEALRLFDISPDWNLSVMRHAQSLTATSSRILSELEPVIQESAPDVIFVQGDTLTTLCGALAGFWARIPVVHVEAGLRTLNFDEPFPEEMNRVLTTRIAALHCAPTEESRAHLLREGVDPKRICVTGNTGIDALFLTIRSLQDGAVIPRMLPDIRSDRNLILVTTHRRESFGTPMENVCRALARLARREDIEIVFPVHPNPQVRAAVDAHLRDTTVTLTDPLDYVTFVSLLHRSLFVISDSGGVQEEAPSLGKPVLVLRDRTERPEAVAAGSAQLVGTDPDVIVTAAERLLDDPESRALMSRGGSPFGDGHASERIVAAVEKYLAERN